MESHVCSYLTRHDFLKARGSRLVALFMSDAQSPSSFFSFLLDKGFILGTSVSLQIARNANILFILNHVIRAIPMTFQHNINELNSDLFLRILSQSVRPFEQKKKTPPTLCTAT